MLWQWTKNTKQVFILDLDGTLIPSAEIDNQCYWQAVFSCFDVHDTAPDIHRFKHVTDSGILDEWCTQKLGRSPSGNEIGQVKTVFLRLLTTAAKKQPRLFRPLAGVEDWLRAVNKAKNVCAGIATGGWRHSARFKLQQSGLDRFGLPMASSDDAIARTDIMQIAARASLKNGAQENVAFTYVGDGEWDFHASRLLGWGFTGIAQGDQAKRLKLAGASSVQADFKSPGDTLFTA